MTNQPTICTVVGARPQIIKAATVSAPLRRLATEILIHTGQHYDFDMSELHVQESQMPVPDLNLGIGSDTHARMTARMLEGLEEAFERYQPDTVLVYGDTNSTLAAALVAAKMHIPVAHVEAGMRSFDMRMPEEVNRVLTDRVSTLLLCPTPEAVENLHAEGMREGVSHTGDVMYDSLLAWKQRTADEPLDLPHGLGPRDYLVLTLHRPASVDDPARLKAILETVAASGERVIFPAHPRTRARLDSTEVGAWLAAQENVTLTQPIGRFQLLSLARHARKVCTDSGGLQKEAFMLETPCVTFRDTTEWTETLRDGWNVLVNADPERIRAALAAVPRSDRPPVEAVYGAGDAGERIARAVVEGAE
jgi:UDP-N-acetylglucosamine 2-epimerase